MHKIEKKEQMIVPLVRTSLPTTLKSWFELELTINGQLA